MKRSKYKIGQKVTVRPDIKDFTDISPIVFYAGKTVTISHCSWSTALKGYVYNTEETGMYIWKEGWLLSPLCYEKIVITSDGVTTTAKKYDGKKLVKEAKAVCSKDDVFNFEVGAGIAMDRLIGREKQQKIATDIADYLRGISTKYLKHRDRIIKDIKGFAKGKTPKPYNGKVVCVDPNGFPYYTKGKIYEVKDGLYFTDDGIPLPCCYRLSSFDDLQRDSVAIWLEVVE